ncbi:mediator of RNA polymerase II transcription subunit 27 isoform X2 [Lepidochelys kempii]|uniref:mediator of RNA polymerase II transcription subunit 27 isoform X2 n=1 Tax=Lepidochelys kempii TaxID=8472 RepID=UPI003C6F923C
MKKNDLMAQRYKKIHLHGIVLTYNQMNPGVVNSLQLSHPKEEAWNTLEVRRTLKIYKLQYHAGLASGLLNQQSLKRSANQMGVSAKRRPKAQPTTLVLPPQYVDDVISRIDRMFPEMSIHLSRPNGTSAMLLVTLGKVLKVIVVMRSLFIDRTIVKGYNEDVHTEDGKVDIWSKSNYQVFQKVTDHATTALLHYQLPQMPDVVVRSFMTWLRSYIKLFQAPCQRCGKFLQDGLPPTWRDFRTLEAFHDTCRQ